MTPRTSTRRNALARTAVVAAALAVVAATGPYASAHNARHQEAPGGTLLLVGGGLKDANAEIYNEIINKAGGAGHARIGVLTGASVPASQDPDAGDPATCSNSECNGAYYADLFKSYGAADAQWVPIDLDHIANAESDAVVAQVNSMTGFFFGGGDQYRYVTTMLHGAAHTDSKVLAAIRAKLAAGAVVSGSSAGAEIASGADMITGGEQLHRPARRQRPRLLRRRHQARLPPRGRLRFLRTRSDRHPHRHRRPRGPRDPTGIRHRPGTCLRPGREHRPGGRAHRNPRPVPARPRPARGQRP